MPFQGKVFKGELENADRNHILPFRTQVAMLHFIGNFVLKIQPRQQLLKSGLFR